MESTITHTLTVTELRDELDATEVRMQQAQTKIDNARERIKNVDIEPVSNEKRERLREQYTRQLETLEAEAIDLVDQTRLNLETVLNIISGDVVSITPEEMSAARASRDYVREDAEHASIPELIDITRRALVTSDKATVYNLVRYIPDRIVRSESSWEDAASKSAGNTLRALITEGRYMLRDKRLDAMHERAIELRSKASELDFEASKRTRSGATYSFQSEHEVSW